MPELVLSKVIGGVFFMGQREYSMIRWYGMGCATRCALRLRDQGSGRRSRRRRVVAAVLVDRLMVNEAHVQHRLQQMQIITNKERAAATRALCQKLRTVDPRMDASLVVVRIDMRMVLVITMEQCLCLQVCVIASTNISNYANTTVGTIGKKYIYNHDNTICAGLYRKL
jgi:hypothetical protein